MAQLRIYRFSLNLKHQVNAKSMDDNSLEA